MSNNILYSKILEGGEKHLLVLHGLFGQSDNWNTIAKRFAEKYTTHLLDLRNHGRSFHSDEMTVPLMAEDLNNYLEHHEIGKAFLLGHSLGGRSVMEFSFKYPEKTEKLIVADMAPKSYPPHHQGIIKGLSAVDFDKISNRSEVDDVLKQYIPEPGVRQFLLKNVYITDDKKYNFRFNLKVLASSYNELVTQNFENKQYIGETLFLKGAKSDYILPEDEYTIKKLFPKAVVIEVPNAGHWLHAENPGFFVNAVMEFLEP